MKILTFYLDGDKYGISIEKVVTIEKNDRKITSVPMADRTILGVVNVRSKIVPVIDLKMVLHNLKNKDMTDISADLEKVNEDMNTVVAEYDDSVEAKKTNINSASKNELDTNKKLILFEIEEKVGALLVDDTDNIINVESEEIEDFEFEGEKAKIVKQEKEIFVLIDIEELLKEK
ncbi:chemotaxis protein CheW [Bacillus toyonensis]|uniref:chemotaxis protein CheW n=1 Tax=Bacillus toyonensis TaxID=155322 RepID=UPI002E2023D2|nr:chemotaxis protein CheW [Bacillus toyonensis]MED2737742.1 chemotaxis protein CheW [Bacillus toyonensis]